MISISCAIMHSPFSSERRRCLEAMIQQLSPEAIAESWHDCQIFGDFHRRGHWWNAKRCMEWGVSLRSTHHLILQDDIMFCQDFVAGLHKLIEVWPDEIISLFFGPRKTFKKGGRWGDAEGPWGQAVIYPHDMLSEFLEWQREHIKPTLRHDDTRVTLFCDGTDRTVKVPFPNVIDHIDDMKSTLNHKGFVPRISDDFLSGSIFDIDWSDTSDMRRSVNSVYNDKKWLVSDPNLS